MGNLFSSRTEAEIRSLEERRDNLKCDYEDLSRRYKELEYSMKNHDSIVSDISAVSIEKFVDTIIDDPSTNIYGFPDAAERAIYRNVLKIVLGSLEKTLSTAKVELFNHKITFHISPVE